MASPRLQRRQARHFNSPDIIHKAAQHSSYAVQHPEKCGQWSSALRDLVTSGVLPHSDGVRSALVLECIELAESKILIELLKCSSLVLQGPMNAHVLSSLLEAIPQEDSPKHLELIGVRFDPLICKLLLQILEKSKTTSLSLNACASTAMPPLGFLGDSSLLSLEVTPPDSNGAPFAELVGELVQNCPGLRDLKLKMPEHYSGLLSIASLQGKLGRLEQLRNLEVSLPSSNRQSVQALLSGLGDVMRGTPLKRMALACRGPGSLAQQTFSDLSRTLAANPHVQELSLTNWTKNSEQAALFIRHLLTNGNWTQRLDWTQRLVQLDLRDNEGLGNDPDLFAGVARMKKLQVLDLRGTAKAFSCCDGLIMLLEHCQMLTCLALPDLDKSFDIPALAKALRRHTSLLHFDVRCPFPRSIEDEKLFAEMLTFCNRRNQPEFQRMLSPRLIEAFTGYMPTNGTPDGSEIGAQPAFRLPRELSEQVDAMGLDVKSTTSLALVNKYIQQVAKEAQDEWEQKKRG